MKLIIEQTNQVEILTETVGGKKRLFIEGVYMTADAKNKNGRIYPREILFNSTQNYIDEYVSQSRALGELNHPEGPTINLDKVSHIIKELRFEGSDVIGKAKILDDTPMGIIAKALIDEGVKLGVSSRAVGTVFEDVDADIVQSDLVLCAIDIVADPSAHRAFVNGIMENKEWIRNGKIWKEMDAEKAKQQIERVSKINREKYALKLSEHYLRQLIRISK